MKTIRNKRFLSVLMVLCMMLTLLPVSSKREIAYGINEGIDYLAVKGYDQVTHQNTTQNVAHNEETVLTGPGIGGTIIFKPATAQVPQTLILSGASIYTNNHTGAIIFSQNKLNIELIGDNTITAEEIFNDLGEEAHGIYSLEDIAISGTGSLTINMSYLDVFGCTATTKGIKSNKNITISSGTITLNCTSRGDGDDYNSNLRREAVGIQGKNVTISGGTVKSICEAELIDATPKNEAYGIYSEEDIIISGGSVEASGTAGTTAAGIQGRAVMITGGTVKATAKACAAVGINGTINTGSSNSLSITGGTVTADGVRNELVSPSAYVYVYGMSAATQVNKISISGGTVTTKGQGQAINGTFEHSNGMITASTAYVGSTHEAYNQASLSNYKYIQYESVPPTPTPGNGGSGGGASAPVIKEGKLEKDQKQDGNAPTANLQDSTEELKAKILSAAEQEQVAAGKDAKVILKVQDISTSVSAEDKKRIEDKLAAEQQNTANPALLYVDISLYKQVGDGQETKVTQTSGKIKISIEVPESMWSTEAGANRTYRVVRIHDGVTEILDGTYDPATHLFTFETDRFSTYALTYQDGNTTPDLNNGGTSDQLTIVKDFRHLHLTAKADKTSQKLSYAKVAGADGYLIYGAQYGKKLKKLADVKGTVRNYTVKKLKKGTYYTYQVKAYKVVDGKKVTIAESSLIHSVTTSKTYGNPTKLIIKKSSITLAVGKTKKVTYQVVLPENKKSKDSISSARFETTNPEIATISKSGTITAKAKGTCDVYVYAQNGVYKKIKVTVE